MRSPGASGRRDESDRGRVAAGLRFERAEFLSALGTEAADRPMAAYEQQLEQTGELPAYDPSTMERVRNEGRFG
jgi:hypothetical protein